MKNFQNCTHRCNRARTKSVPVLTVAKVLPVNPNTPPTRANRSKNISRNGRTRSAVLAWRKGTRLPPIAINRTILISRLGSPKRNDPKCRRKLSRIGPGKRKRRAENGNNTAIGTNNGITNTNRLKPTGKRRPRRFKTSGAAITERPVWKATKTRPGPEARNPDVNPGPRKGNSAQRRSG